MTPPIKFCCLNQIPVPALSNLYRLHCTARFSALAPGNLVSCDRILALRSVPNIFSKPKSYRVRQHTATVENCLLPAQVLCYIHLDLFGLDAGSFQVHFLSAFGNPSQFGHQPLAEPVEATATTRQNNIPIEIPSGINRRVLNALIYVLLQPAAPAGIHNLWMEIHLRAHEDLIPKIYLACLKNLKF